MTQVHPMLLSVVFMHISVNNTHGLISYFQCSEFGVFYNVSLYARHLVIIVCFIVCAAILDSCLNARNPWFTRFLDSCLNDRNPWCNSF